MVTVTTFGQKPNLRLNTEQALLLSAWAYGLKKDDSIHRLSLFAFVQSHISNVTEENLQGFIEKDYSNWNAIGNGYYKLTSSAFNKLSKFGKQNIILPKGLVYTFNRKINNYEISVSVDSIKRKYITRQNNIDTKADEIINTITRITNDDIPTDRTSKPRKVLNWILSGNDYSWAIETKIEHQVPQEFIKAFKEADEDERFPEGKEKYRIHKSKERNQKLIALKKHKAFLQNPNLPCEICGFSFKVRYGEIGDKFIEAHHILPISELTEEIENNLNDLILVCANCHKMIHKRRPWLTMQEIKKLIT
jgi:predicted HNH restriction endonuclease